MNGPAKFPDASTPCQNNEHTQTKPHGQLFAARAVLSVYENLNAGWRRRLSILLADKRMNRMNRPAEGNTEVYENTMSRRIPR